MSKPVQIFQGYRKFLNVLCFFLVQCSFSMLVLANEITKMHSTLICLAGPCCLDLTMFQGRRPFQFFSMFSISGRVGFGLN